MSLSLLELPFQNRYTNLPTISEYHFNDVNQQLIKNYSSQIFNGQLGTPNPFVTNKGLLIAEGQYAEIPINSVKPTSQGLTILCYFKATTKTSGMRIFKTNASSTYSMYCYSNDSVGFDFNGSSIQNYSFNYLNNKICCIATFSPNNSISLFINKNQVANTNISFDETVDIGSICYVGGKEDDGQNYFNGEIYTFITYPFVLNQDQINIETDRVIKLNNKEILDNRTVLRYKAGTNYTDITGKYWESDNSIAQGGNTLLLSDFGKPAATNTYDPLIYDRERYGRPNEIEYNIPIQNGNYSINIMRAERFAGLGGRSQNTIINGVEVESNLDLIAIAPYASAVIFNYLITITNNQLIIHLTNVVDVAFINAIEIIPV